jgi:hypothetical protein
VSDVISNNDVILWALYELGGAEQFVDVEEVFLKAFELAPRRFCWRIRADLVDYKKCSLALGELGRRTPRPLINQGEYMRMISIEGQKWIEENFDRLAEELGKDRDVRATRRRSTGRLLSQVLRSPVYTAWLNNGEMTSEKWKVAELLRCAPDNTKSVFQERVNTLRSVAYSSGHEEVLRFLDQMVSDRREWFE